MNEKTITQNSFKALETNMHDAVIDGMVVHDIPTKIIFVANSTERDALENVLPGQFVATYGCSTVWQKKGDGTWAEV